MMLSLPPLTLAPLPLFQVTLEGHTGAKAEFMGVYSLSHVAVNDAPYFVKRVAGGGMHFITRSNRGATGGWIWIVSSQAKKIVHIQSSQAANLPSEAGLGWQYIDESGARQHDPNLRCIEVRASTSIATKEELMLDRPQPTSHPYGTAERRPIHICLPYPQWTLRLS